MSAYSFLVSRSTILLLLFVAPLVTACSGSTTASSAAADDIQRGESAGTVVCASDADCKTGEACLEQRGGEFRSRRCVAGAAASPAAASPAASSSESESETLPTPGDASAPNVDGGAHDADAGPPISDAASPDAAIDATPTCSTPSASLTTDAALDFGTSAIGGTVERSLEVRPTAGAVLAGVSGELVGAPWRFKGGAYPGVGGTCGATIDHACTVVVEYAPDAICGEAGELRLSHQACPSRVATTIALTGNGVGVAKTSCATRLVRYVSAAGDDANDGSSPATPKRSIAGALAGSPEGLEVRVASGTYHEELAIEGCTKLIGGYAADFASRNPQVNVTSIVGATASTAPVAGRGAIHVEGFHLQGDIGLTFGMATPFIVDNDISGGFQGVQFWESNCGAFRQNRLRADTEGLNYYKSKLPVTDNVIVSSHVGASVYQNDGGRFAHNVVRAPHYAIMAWGQEGMVFEANQLRSDMTGALTWSMIGGVWRSNAIYGKDGGIVDMGQAAFDQNVYAGNTVVSHGPLSVYGGVFTNNVFVVLASGGISFGQDTTSFENNALVGDVWLGENHVAANAVTAIKPEDLGLKPAAVGTRRFVGNIAHGSESDFFVSFGGTDGDPTTLDDNDWRPLAASPLATGGKDATLSDCGLVETAVSCGGGNVDFTGGARHAPFSIGAYNAP